MTKQINWKQEIISYAFLLFGSALFAIGDVMFVNPYNLAPGGTYGLSNVLNAMYPWKVSLYAICMDIPLLIIGTWILGPKFGFKTILSTFLIFGCTYILESTWGYAPVIFEHKMDVQLDDTWLNILGTNTYFKPDYFLNTVVSGGIYGLAIGFVFKSGATSGGSDIISMILHKYTKISLGTLVMIVDSIITLTSLMLGNFRLPIYSILLIVIESKIIDLVVDGVKSYKTAFIITDKIEDVRLFIINDLDRGGTCFVGSGLFKGQERKMIYTNLDRADLVKLKLSLRSIDPNAFVNVIESAEVMGNGFVPLPHNDK
ncbi:MAG: YitT family protein [Bacteroidales bacterium]|nr:YitT family protein [Bacteroidales bacterium]